MWNVVNCRTSADSGAQSLRYRIEFIVGKKSVPGACNAILIGAFHLYYLNKKIEKKETHNESFYGCSNQWFFEQILKSMF